MVRFLSCVLEYQKGIDDGVFVYEFNVFELGSLGRLFVFIMETREVLG